MNKWWIFNSKTEFLDWLGFKPSLVVTHLSIEQMCQPLSSHLIFKKRFLHICHNNNFWTFQQTLFWRKHWVSYPEVTKLETSERDIVTADFHQAFQTASSYSTPSSGTKNFFTDEIRHNQVNEMDITQWSFISVCFQPDSL